MRQLIGIFLLAAALSMPGVKAGTPLPDGPHVVASGEGRVTVAPDMAELSVSVDVNAPTAAAAKQAADAAVGRFLAVLGAQGVADADVEASELMLEEDVEVSDAGQRVSNGFGASRRVEVKLRDLSKFNAVLDGALAAGMNRFGTTRFASQRRDALRAEARAKAARNARERAGELAAGFGARLGSVYSIDSLGSGTGSRYRGQTLDRIEVTGSAIDTPEPARYLKPEIEFVESVSAVFSLQP
ncbi:SIMPL domain-containing protein [Luteimonas sp. e5]